MKSVRIHHLAKQYGATRALDDVSLEIAPGELFFLLGPSGCGKTTLLRAVAGFVEPDRGQILLGEQDATHLPPQRRNTGMVFQSYALWPHMTVRQNVEFGLKLMKLDRNERRRRVDEALEMVHLLPEAVKKPNALSGGQQQRVALARALVIRPTCLLLDEPLSNLDAKLREEMRGEIRRICKQAGLTAIYVTHDQKEALAIADRIAVMRDGQVAQVGTPRELYRQPASPFVADFLGQINFLNAVIDQVTGDQVILKTALGRLDLPRGKFSTTIMANIKCQIGIRLEAIRHVGDHQKDFSFPAVIEQIEFSGELTHYRLRSGGAQPVWLQAIELNGLGGNEAMSDGQWFVNPEEVLVFPNEIIPDKQ